MGDLRSLAEEESPGQKPTVKNNVGTWARVAEAATTLYSQLTAPYFEGAFALPGFHAKTKRVSRSPTGCDRSPQVAFAWILNSHNGRYL